MAISSAQSVVVLPDYTTINVVRSTSGDGTAVLAAPGVATDYYVIDLLQLENLSANVVSCVVKSGTRTLWSYRAPANEGLLIDKKLVCGKGEPIYLNLDVTGSDVRIQALVYIFTG